MKSLLVLAMAVMACSPARPSLATHPDRTVLTRDDIEAVTAASSMYDVIRRLRPEYLNSRGRTSLLNQGDPRPVVFLDEQEYGPIESLRNLQPDLVQEVRFYASSSAVAKFGSRYGTGVIRLQSRAR